MSTKINQNLDNSVKPVTKSNESDQKDYSKNITQVLEHIKQFCLLIYRNIYLLESIFLLICFYVVFLEAALYLFWQSYSIIFKLRTDEQNDKKLGIFLLVMACIIKLIQIVYSYRFREGYSETPSKSWEEKQTVKFNNILNKNIQKLKVIEEKKNEIYQIYKKYSKKEQSEVNNIENNPTDNYLGKLWVSIKNNYFMNFLFAFFAIRIPEKYYLVHIYTRKYCKMNMITYLSQDDQKQFDALKYQYKLLTLGIYYDFLWFKAVLSVFFIPLVYVHYYLIEEISDLQSTAFMIGLFFLYFYFAIIGQYSLQFFPIQVSSFDKIAYLFLKCCELLSKVILTCLFIKTLIKGDSFNYKSLIVYIICQTFQVTISSLLFYDTIMRNYTETEKNRQLKNYQDNMFLENYFKKNQKLEKKDQKILPYILVNIYRTVFYLSFYEQPVFFPTLKNYQTWDNITDLPNYYQKWFSLFYYERIRFTYYIWFLRIFENLNLILYLFHNIDILPIIPPSVHISKSKHLFDKLEDFERDQEIIDYILRNQQTHLFVAIILTLIMFIYYLSAVLRKFNKDKNLEKYKDAYED